MSENKRKNKEEIEYLIHDDRPDVYPEEKEFTEEDEKFLKEIEDKYKK